MRLLTVHENKRYMELSRCQARWKMLCSFPSLIDLVSFLAMVYRKIAAVQAAKPPVCASHSPIPLVQVQLSDGFC